MRAVKLTAVLALSLGCSKPSLSGYFACRDDSDCPETEVCAPMQSMLSACGQEVSPDCEPADPYAPQACQPRAEVPIIIGMSGPMSGPSADLGQEMVKGVRAAFDRTNAAGGLHGRRIVLRAKDDQYVPSVAVMKTRDLLDVLEVRPEGEPDLRGANSVFALLGNVGTPTMLETAPIANKNKVIYFGPFTGAQSYLRDGTNSPYVYNYRAGYFDEARAAVDFLRNSRQPRILDADNGRDHRYLAAFTQSDAYGAAGYSGLVRAYGELVGPLPSETAIRQFTYIRDDLGSVDPAFQDAADHLSSLLAASPEAERVSVAFFMVDTYQPGSAFIRSIRNWQNEQADRAARLDLLFIHLSFVGADSLIEELRAAPSGYQDVRDETERSYTEGVMVMQVVPYYLTEFPGVQDYRSSLGSEKYSFTSLEGFLAGTLFAKAVELTGPTLSTESLRQTLDTRIVDFDIGLGPVLSFSTTDRQASDQVWGTMLEADGTFTVRFQWDPERGIRSN